MKTTVHKSLMLLVCIVTAALFSSAQSISDVEKIFNQEYNLVPQHSQDTQYYEMISKLQNHALDGTPQGWDIYHLFLRCVPSSDRDMGDEYTCLRFTVQLHQMPEVSIPSLKNWRYYFSLTPNAMDEKGQVFGIDHSKFETLNFSDGNIVPAANAYFIYNTFVDFHSMNLFSEKSPGNGAQNLKHIGDRIVHAAAYTQAPVNLGSQVGEGSYFKNGEVTLRFKGLGMENQKICAIMEYDSGESSYYMILTPAPGIRVPSKGSSHYWGDIFKDIKTGWIQKATLHEMVVSETTVPGVTTKVNAVVERSIEITNVRPSQVLR